MGSLTVCIPTIPTRRSLLSRALCSLTIFTRHEVLVADGDRPMGDKINEMFAAASGDYVVVLDDDDWLSDTHGIAIDHHLTGGGPDFIGHDILWLEDGRYAGLVAHSLDGDPEWSNLDRGVSPKCPVRTTIARAHTFGNEYAADRSWSKVVHAACETGSYIPAPLYVYDHWADHMVGTEPTDPRYARPQRDVGTWPYDPERITWI